MSNSPADPAALTPRRPGPLPKKDVLSRDVGRATVLVHLESDSIYELNASGARIWALMGQGLTCREICIHLREESGATDAELETMVNDLVAELVGAGLVDAGE